jgi:hypothetical protein
MDWVAGMEGGPPCPPDLQMALTAQRPPEACDANVRNAADKQARQNQSDA